MSPEQKAGRQYTEKVDIYALAIIFFEMNCPFETEMERCTVRKEYNNGGLLNLAIFVNYNNYTNTTLDSYVYTSYTLSSKITVIKD